MGRIKVLVVDDSALVRKLLSELLAEDPELEVVGAASDPLSARDKIKALNPDVLTLDVEMPKMDGLTFLANLMRLRPMPVVMVSSLAEANAAVTLEALELGAVDFVTKPKVDLAHTLADYSEEIIRKVKQAAKTRVRPREPVRPMVVEEKHTADVVLPRGPARMFRTTERLVAIGASTGGTEAIKEVLMRMPADGPIVVITQHIPPVFSKAFAERLNRVVPMAVQEAVDGQQLLPGHAYVAPGGQHLIVARSGARYVGRISDAPPVNRHRPSVDVLFRSVAQEVGKNAVGVILTGMGDDGARGLKEMRDSGAFTIAQDEQSSVVWGMPGEAVKHGGVALVSSLLDIPAHIMDAAEKAA